VRLERLLRLAQHLVVWRLGKIVPTITALSIYGVPPTTMVTASGHYGARGVAGLLGSISDEFERTFQKSFSLPSFLAIFNRLLPLKRHVADWMERGLDKKDLSLMLRWAVNKNLLVPYKRYMYLLPLPSANVSSPFSPLHIKVVSPKSDADRLAKPPPLSSSSRRHQQPLQQKGGAWCQQQRASRLVSSLADESREYQILRGVFEAGCLDGRTELTEVVWQWNSTETMLQPSPRDGRISSRGGDRRGGDALVPPKTAATTTRDDGVKSALVRFRDEHEQRAITLGGVLKMVAKYEKYISLVVRPCGD